MLNTQWFFDCDGVLLDSNAVKTKAFASVASAYGEAAADQLVRHHLLHGGVSRFEKFEWFFRSVLEREPGPGEVEALLEQFGARCARELEQCAMEPDAPQLLSALVSAGAAAHVVSGGLESEVAGALAAHGIAGFFASINGSPRTKDEILLDLTSRSARASDGVFVGDSRLDMEVAARFGLRRIFVTQWSEFEDWPLYVAEHDDILVVPNLQHLSRSIGSVDSGS